MSIAAVGALLGLLALPFVCLLPARQPLATTTRGAAAANGLPGAATEMQTRSAASAVLVQPHITRPKPLSGTDRLVDLGPP